MYTVQYTVMKKECQLVVKKSFLLIINKNKFYLRTEKLLKFVHGLDYRLLGLGEDKNCFAFRWDAKSNPPT